MSPFLLAIVLATPAAADQALYEQLCTQVAQAYESEKGGFVKGGQEPHESAVELALMRAADGDSEWLEWAESTVDWTWALYDSVGGGFLQQLNHADPSSPHFEKRTDSNAARLENLIDAWQVTGSATYKSRARQAVDYFDRFLLDGRGGFMQGQFGGFTLVPEANGHAIHAWMRWASSTNDDMKKRFGLKSIDRVWEMCWDSDLGLMRKDELGTFTSPPLLIDQVEMGRACMLAAQLFGREVDRQRAVALGRMIVERYEDPKNNGFYTQAVLDQKKGTIKRAKRHFDENARAARFLCELSQYTGDARYEDAARRAWQSWEKKLEKAKFDGADWALAMRVAMGAEPTAFSKR